MHHQSLYNARYCLANTLPEPLWAGESLLLEVELENTGTVPWLNFGPHAVALAYRLFTAAGQPLIRESLRSFLPFAVPPGRRVILEVAVTPPDEPGDYRLEVELLEEGVTWFSARGVAPLNITFTVQPATAPRVCIINGNCVLHDAVGSHVINQIRTLRQAGYHTLLLTEFVDPRLPTDVRRSMVKIHLYDLQHPDDHTRAAVQHFFAADIVIVNYSTYYELVQAIKLVGNSIVIFDYHGVTPPRFWDDQSDGYDHLVKGYEHIKLVGYADYASGHSTFTAAELIATGHIPAERVSVMPYAVVDTPLDTVQNPVEVQLNDPDPDLLARHSLAGKHVLLYVGRMARNKCIHVLVEALAQVRRQHPDTVLLLVGNNQATPYRAYVAEVEQRAAELDCTEAVIFTGPVPSVGAYYDLCHLFVTASVHEGFGMPVIEAMARGKPVIAADAAALPETMGGSGLLFTPHDASELAAHINDLLAQVPPHPHRAAARHPLLAAATAPGSNEPLLGEGQRIGFVTPRYGTEILGGAERLIRGWTEELARRGYPVEVLTTCTARMDDWSNYYTPGVEEINGVTVRRFATDQVDAAVFHGLLRRLNQGERISYSDELAFVHNDLQSADLNTYLREQRDQFVCLFFAPYLFGTTWLGAQQVPGKAMLVPCMHNEASARLLVFREMLEEAQGIFFNAQAESAFTSTQLGVINPFRMVVGYGFDPNPPAGDGAAFRVRYHLPDQLLLYSGRLEAGKNVPLLLDYFVRYKDEHPGPLTLVLTGSGDVPLPARPDVVALGILPEDELPHAFAAATALCQPSLNESFSIVMMESWLQGRPCIVHEHCPVTSGHIHASGGGYTFENYAGFCAALGALLCDPDEASTRGQRGYAYVCTHYAWDVVIERLLDGIRRFARPGTHYERLARKGIRRALHFVPQRFNDAFLGVVAEAQRQRIGLDQQQRQRIEQAAHALVSASSEAAAPVTASAGSRLRQWTRQLLTRLHTRPAATQVRQQAQFTHDVFTTLVPMLEQSFAEQRRLQREIALLRARQDTALQAADQDTPQAAAADDKLSIG